MKVSIWLLTMFASSYCALHGQEPLTIRQAPPELTRITPEVASPGTRVELAGYRPFRVPPNLPEGEARLQLIELRSGGGLRSNTLSFWITRGPTPVEIAAGWLMPVAPGQWVDLPVVSDHPLKSAERVEVTFQQAGRLYTVAVDDPQKSRWLHVRVPQTLSPDQVELRTRTLVGDQVSAWSKPVTYQLLAKPVASRIYSVEVVRSRSEGRIYIGPETRSELIVHLRTDLM